MAAVTSLLGTAVLVFWCAEWILCEDVPCDNYQNATCTACTGEELRLQCPDGQVLTGFIMAGFRDRSDSTAICGYQSTDCLAEPMRLVPAIAECMWKASSCNFELWSFEPAVRDGLCDIFTMSPRYLMTSGLKCQPETSLHQVCTPEHQVVSISPGTSGHILSPGFPKPYSQVTSAPWQQGCSVNMATVQGLGIRLVSAYMDVGGHAVSCQTDYILVTWEEGGATREMKHCGRERLSVDILAQTALLTFKFTDDGQTSQGFALQYTAFDLPVETPGAIEELPTAKDTTSVIRESSTRHPLTTTLVPERPDLSTLLAAVFSVSIAVLLILVCVAITIMCCRRKHSYCVDKATASLHGAQSDTSSQTYHV